jgi:hypothetical protein
VKSFFSFSRGASLPLAREQSAELGLLGYAVRDVLDYRQRADHRALVEKRRDLDGLPHLRGTGGGHRHDPPVELLRKEPRVAVESVPVNRSERRLVGKDLEQLAADDLVGREVRYGVGATRSRNGSSAVRRS